jgi:hypothetical protein
MTMADALTMAVAAWQAYRGQHYAVTGESVPDVDDARFTLQWRRFGVAPDRVYVEVEGPMAVVPA